MFSPTLPAESLDYIHGGTYTREDGVQFSESLLQDAARILCHNLLFTTEHFLHGFNLMDIVDNCMDLSEGYSFLSEYQNDFSRPEWACNIQANIWSKPGLSTEDQGTLACVLHEASLGTRTGELPHHLVQQYENNVQEFLEYLILLILLSGGQPDGELRISQGFVSELVSLRFANTKHDLRPIYVAHGGVVQIDGMLTGRPRILPRHVGAMLVVYLLHVRPFLASISPYHPAASSEYLFPTIQGHWHTDSYTYLIPRESQRRLNKSLVLEDINDVHIRYLRVTHPISLTSAMWERLNAESGPHTWPVGSSEQLPSSNIFQQLRMSQSRTPSPSLNSLSTMATRTPSPAISDVSLSSSGVLLPYQYSLPLVTAIPQIKTSFQGWPSTATSSPSPSPVWTPTSSMVSSEWDAMFSPRGSFSAPTSHQQFDYSTSGYTWIPASAPATAPPSPIKQEPEVEMKSGISKMGFISGYPPEKRKHNANPKSAAKKKKNAKNNKVLNSTPMKKSPKSAKVGKRGSRSASRQSDDDGDTTSSTGSVTQILNNLGLTSSVLKREPDSERPQAFPTRAKCIEDPIKQTDRMLANMGLTKLVTR